jgi:CheY-like chemotaxis protein
MIPHGVDLIVPRILVVDDERQVLSSVRLRIGKLCHLTCCLDPREALAKLQSDEFDVCLTDIHMPQMNGLKFIEAAQRSDPLLGYVILSAFDTDANLRRSIPLPVYEFISKPLPEPEGLEDRIAEWTERTRQRRREHALAKRAGTIAQDLHVAVLEREVELVASETARDALLQTANLLTTIQAHLTTATGVLAHRARSDPALRQLLRGLDEARKTTDAAISVSEGFFNCGYGNRESSPALPLAGLQHAINIALRMCNAEATGKQFDIVSVDDRLPIRGLNGIEFALMLVPVLAQALLASAANSTIRVGGSVAQLDSVVQDNRFKGYLWVNRRKVMLPKPGMLLLISMSSPALTRADAERWLNSNHDSLANMTARGLVRGLQKSQGLLGVAIAPEAKNFSLVLALPI